MPAFHGLCRIKAQKALHAVYGASYIFYDLQVSMIINQTFIEIINISLLEKLGNSDPIVFQVYGVTPCALSQLHRRISYTGGELVKMDTSHTHPSHFRSFLYFFFNIINLLASI